MFAGDYTAFVTDALRDLTYCTNVHPAETLGDVQRVIEQDVVATRTAWGRDSMNVGLRLSARAARELNQPGATLNLRERMAQLNLYTTTLNGFPYGAFHGQAVKERVYRPDWQEPERVDYTRDLFRVLSQLLPDGRMGSVSTVPGAYKPRLLQDALARMTQALSSVALDLLDIERETGKRLVLALEPEPGCFLETTSDAVGFFQDCLWHSGTVRSLAKRAGIDDAQALEALQRYIGVCLDTCHASVEFETPLGAYRRLTAAGICVAKVQVSCGLVLPSITEAALTAVRRYDEPVYLHQVVVKDETELRRYDDLGDALLREPLLVREPPLLGVESSCEWRVHFHVPVYRQELGAFRSTQPELAELLIALGREDSAVQLEVETYTWSVLPDDEGQRTLPEAIARELSWTAQTFRGSP